MRIITTAPVGAVVALLACRAVAGRSVQLEPKITTRWGDGQDALRRIRLFPRLPCETVGVNQAAALHRILKSLQESDQPLPTAWANVLGAEYGSVEFVRRHSEVLGLMSDTLRIMDALPTTVRERHARYVPIWWNAMLMPRHDWKSTGGSATLDESNLDHLQSLADSIETRITFGASRSATDRLDQLQAGTNALLDQVRAMENEDALPPAVVRVLISDLKHVLWLIESVDLVGASRIADEAQRTASAVMAASSEVTDPATRSAWIDSVHKFFLTVSAFVVAASGVVTPAITSANDLLEQAAITRDRIVEIVDPDQPSSTEQSSGKGPTNGEG